MSKKYNLFIAFLIQVLVPFSGLASDEIFQLIDDNSGNGKGFSTRKCIPLPYTNGRTGVKTQSLEEPCVNMDKERKLTAMAAINSSNHKSTPIQGKILNIRGLINAAALEKLGSSQYTSMYLEGTYGDDDSSPAFYDYHLIISPSLINPNVEILQLHSCGLTYQNIQEVGSFKKLRELSLSSNRINDESILKFVTPLQTLERLNLSFTDITNNVLLSVSKMQSLINLDLSYNSGITDEGIQYFYEHPRIKVLIIKGNKISSSGYERLKQAIPTVDYFPG